MKAFCRYLLLLAMFSLSCTASRPPSPPIERPTRPDWVENVPQSDLYLYAVGWGDTPLHAEEDARGQIAQSVRTEVRSVFRNTVREVATTEGTYFREVTDHQIEVVCRQLRVSGIEVVAFYERAPVEHACLVRILRDRLERVLEEQQEHYARIILGYVEEGRRAENAGQLGTALKQYFKAYSVLPRLPYPLSVSSAGREPQEVRGFLYGRILTLLSEMRWEHTYARNLLNPSQSMLTLILRGAEPDRAYDGLLLEVSGKPGKVEKDTDGRGEFGFYADPWRAGTDVRLEIRVLSRSFAPYEELTASEQDHPAVCISWNDVQEFIRRLNEVEGVEVYRLPTEAEWEYSCRAGTTTRWSFGEDESRVGECVWYDANAWDVGETYAHAVGTKLPNPWGLYDMHGNVREWVQDYWGSYTSEAQVDPTGPTTGSNRVYRGGSLRLDAGFVRSAIRYFISPGNRSYNIGARLLRQGQ